MKELKEKIKHLLKDCSITQAVSPRKNWTKNTTTIRFTEIIYSKWVKCDMHLAGGHFPLDLMENMPNYRLFREARINLTINTTNNRNRWRKHTSKKMNSKMNMNSKNRCPCRISKNPMFSRHIRITRFKISSLFKMIKINLIMKKLR